ncbi:nucleolar protein [Coemansia sp. RSA 1722]|nr:nucleolar protein [Coemansia sp. RSA 486]KAJ2232227.1 nucleolar protein [Coemansia sp. RSA 485]KAJ2605122.1 nucleolar protein [Coemansia sp. RSA 1722]
MGRANKKTAKTSASKTAPKATVKSTPKTTKAAPVAKPAPKKSKKAAAVVEEKEESEPESEEEEEEEEQTIYEEVSDDSAVEGASDSEEEDDIEGDSADEQEEEPGFVKLDEDSDASDDEVDEKALLAGIESSDEATDYSDNDETEDAFKSNAAKISLEGKASTIAKVKLSSKQKQQGPGVVYVGRIPHGFYEAEMTGYFSQFGDIVNLRLSRNPKTGSSRHFAFIRFKYAEVAKIVAQTMNNYLLFDRLLKCVVIPEDKVHPALFKPKVVQIRRDTKLKAQIAKHNKVRTPKQQNAHANKLIENENKLRRKLADAGIEYDFPGFKKAKQAQKQ